VSVSFKLFIFLITHDSTIPAGL